MAIHEIEESQTRIVGRTIVFGECFTCGIPIAMTPNQRRHYDERKMSMKCVPGHSTIRAKSDTQILEEKLAAAQDQVTRAESAFRNSEQMLETKIKENRRLKKQATKGQCPHCQEYFSSLHRHMRSQHPDKLA